MSQLAAQVSLYPLGQDELSPAIDEVLRVFEERGVLVEVGPMSTMLSGETGTLFSALEEATRTAHALGRVVMVITVSNACSVPEPPAS